MKGYHSYKECIDACLRCAAICNHCASSCTLEEDVTMMATCIRLDMECAAICYATAQVMSIGGANARELATICAMACDACAEECAQHKNEHCQECAAICRECAAKCRAIESSVEDDVDQNDETYNVPVDPAVMHSDYGSSGAAPVGAFDTYK